MKEEKTNVMRVLTQKKIAYKEHIYTENATLSGEEIANLLGEDSRHVFKTLVMVGKTGTNYVFMVPVCDEVDLKKAAAAVHEKSMEMLKSKDLLPLTGYVHGGCSPIGMKKMFKTIVHLTAKDFETICFSGGKIGYQVEVTPSDLSKIVPFEYADLIVG